MRKPLFHFLIGIFCLGISSCGTTNQVAINTLEPAAVELSKDIRRIGIVKTKSSVQNLRDLKGLGKAIANEDASLSEVGQEAALNGLLEELMADSRFDSVILLKNEADLTYGNAGTPSEVSWTAIQKLCETHKLDAIFSLAYYQTNTQYSLKKTKMARADMIRREAEVKGHEINLETLIENGWRIYDPFSREVLDEFVFREELKTSARGTSPLRALMALNDRKDSLVFKSKTAGHAYGARLQPNEHTVYRKYHVKGSDNLAMAESHIADENWDSAVALWQRDTNHEKDKVRAMTCYNLAVFSELTGNLEEALSWAYKSDEHQHSKETGEYIETLKLRIAKDQLARKQLAELGR
ncbi:DUF6340 family protein [Poritiphilus flavus]|uniref:Uncharacterized protein n=1 Tax=Poritiphilus flavus TaxID=2697053 RepID=A0A6L9EEL5_9FLAO|nr:DUF6340 family protein [Poritiphilus flavus]NAS13167.1 hypothetical protein [Poritiphilus flavus]